jgi:predicted dehydrogenase
MGFKICLVGCGDIALHQHGPSIALYAKETADTTFAACCDVDEARAKKFAEAFGIANYYTDMDEMLDREKPDAVSLNVPVALTCKIACVILAKGYPLITEKPPGMDADENNRMASAARGIPNRVAFNRRYMPVVTRAMELLDSFGAGSVMDISYRMVRVNRRDADFATTAIHGIDLVRHVAGADYTKLDMRYAELPQYGGTVANFHLQGETRNGVRVSMDFLPMSGVNTERLEINTHHGLISLELPIWAGCYDGFGKLVHSVNNKDVLCLKGNEIANSDHVANNDAFFILGGFYHENASFFDAVRKGVTPTGEISTGLQAVDIANKISNRTEVYHA